MKKLKPTLLLPLILLLLLLGYLAWQVFIPVRSDQLALKVAKGDNARVIADKLVERGIIRSKPLFLLLARLRGTDRALKAGTYSMGGHYNLPATLSLLEKGTINTLQVTLSEGLSLYKTLKKLDRSGLASYDSLYAAATDSAFVYALTGFRLPSLEGFLYPETYNFDLESKPREMLKLMTAQFFAVLKEAGISPDSLPGFYDKLILASIVERESGSPEEMELIAGVFRNRLERGMNLQSCVTVNYLLEQRDIERKVLTYGDIAINSAYNTYRNPGLPPSPICNPSLRAIKAALNPADTDFLYFVANRKGGNDFSKTYAEHLQKMKLYHRTEWE